MGRRYTIPRARMLKELKEYAKQHVGGIEGLKERRRTLLYILKKLRKENEGLRKKAEMLLMENIWAAAAKEREGDVIIIRKDENPKLRVIERDGKLIKYHTWLALERTDFENETVTSSFTVFHGEEVGDLHAHPYEERVAVFSGKLTFHFPYHVPLTGLYLPVREGEVVVAKPCTNHQHIHKPTYLGEELVPTIATAVKPPTMEGPKSKGFNKKEGEVIPMDFVGAHMLIHKIAELGVVEYFLYYQTLLITKEAVVITLKEAHILKKGLKKDKEIATLGPYDMAHIQGNGEYIVQGTHVYVLTKE